LPEANTLAYSTISKLRL